MKKIEAIIRKTKFEDVKEALLEADIEWFSYYDVRGVGKARQGRIYRGVVYDTSSIERILISIVVRDKERGEDHTSHPEDRRRRARSATGVSSSSPSRTLSAYVPASGEISPFTTPSKRNNPSQTIQYNKQIR